MRGGSSQRTRPGDFVARWPRASAWRSVAYFFFGFASGLASFALKVPFRKGSP